ncbi:HAMP domain-containing sensor histidine kinase [uncultured Halopseudomonas sp.]|uniref:sensor histidine kinase n=1 Tax=uncultured Halopseudomonas sp. TaxID=2901193 RepID=UPI0030EBEE00|tara:strand:+ start:18045 stop:19307 length:1263 start_codon:yes stop_codon:yes gene_type:complete
MKTKHPLVRRIIIAFTLMTLIVSGGFSLGIVAIVHFIEEHLVTQGMAEELDSILHKDLAQGLPPRLDAKTRLFASHIPGYEIPASFIGLDDGFAEIVDDTGAYYLFVRDTPQQRFMLVREQAEFEARETALFTVVFAGFILSGLAAWLLGWMMARTIIAPLARLAHQVRHRDQLLTLAPHLAPDYPKDEVGHLAAAFDATLGQLRSSLERERFFTSDVSHELRTPLMVIASSAELLETAELDEREQRQLNRIKRASAEISELVETFLLLARANTKQNPLSGNATLEQVAHEQAKRWAPRFADQGLDFRLIVEEPNDVLFHGGFLNTVMSNLIRNALHYTAKGEIRLLLSANGFRVEDSGQGVPSAQQDDIFKPFVRGSEARGEGLGLGLSLVKRICAYQGWEVRMYSLPTEGSCFEVTLI